MSYGQQHGGYDNEDGFGRERPQKEILFRAETMREILSQAVETGSHDIGDELRASISTYSTQSPPRSSASRQNSMRNTPPRDSSRGSGGRTYRNADGDLVETWDGEEEPPLRAHCNDPEWNDLPRAPPSRNNTGLSTHRNTAGDYVTEHTGSQPPTLRTHSQYSPPGSEGRRSPPIYYSRDSEGNQVQQFDGNSEDLRIRTHYVDDEPQGRPVVVQRTNSGRY